MRRHTSRVLFLPSIDASGAGDLVANRLRVLIPLARILAGRGQMGRSA